MAPTDADTPGAATFEIQLPPGWWELPLDEAHPDTEITNALRAHRPELPEQESQQLGEYLGRLTVQARASGVLLCGLGVMADDDDKGLVAASVVVAAAPTRLHPSDLQRQGAALARRGFPGPADPPPAECSVVTLSRTGSAIRVQSHAQSPGSDLPVTGVNDLLVQYFAPVPGADATMVLTFSSPVLTGHEPRDELVELFDAMAQTFCFVDAQGDALPPRPEP